MFKDKDLEFEHVVWPYRAAVPFLFFIGAYVQVKKALYRIFGYAPLINCWFVDGMSIGSRKVKDGAATWKALDAVYNFRKGEGCNGLIRTVDVFWMRVRNAQAVRNRLKIVKRELSNAVLTVAKDKTEGEPIRILSLAAGSGQGVIEAVRDLSNRGIRCQVRLVDRDLSALDHAYSLAEQHGVACFVEVREGDAISFYRDLGEFKPDIIEMCGLMDYLRDSLAIALIRKIHKYLRTGGFFLTCHIHPNAEEYFLRHQENWDMLYRTPAALQDLLVNGGFLSSWLYTEPHGIHSVVVMQKM